MSWSQDSAFIYVKFNRSTFAIPLRHGVMFPPVPEAGFRTEVEVARLPGARRISDAAAFTGPNPSVYAFTRVATQRNIYRIPVP